MVFNINTKEDVRREIVKALKKKASTAVFANRRTPVIDGDHSYDETALPADLYLCAYPSRSSTFLQVNTVGCFASYHIIPCFLPCIKAMKFLSICYY